ncbi:TetR family transcriptional regulator [Nocardia brasiliensis]|uniref:TetR family transcriptional regulator n=1 Tax=Nocardia brasiliensis TaxID=37326 RepID=UPI002457E9F4|nr:TetR family transcriptional regulator [Nocardia brasiliensis]
MARLTRAEQQDRTRRKVLEAAGAEFAERGFRNATVDGIAERADLTRGAVYSNFPGKRALYFAVLAHGAEHAPPPTGRKPADTVSAALHAFAGVWMQRIPRSAVFDTHSSGQLRSPSLSLDLIPEITSDEGLRHAFSRLLAFDAIVLGHCMRRLGGTRARSLSECIGTAESVLTILYGATQLSFAAPEFVDPEHVMTLCGQVAELDTVAVAISPRSHQDRPSTRLHRPWTPPARTDLMRVRPARFDRQGMIAILGLNRLGALAGALAAAPPDAEVTVAIATKDLSELGSLARLAVLDFSRSLRHAFPASALAQLQVVVDESGALAAACGIDRIDDDTEAAVGTTRGHLIDLATGPGACDIVAGRLSGNDIDERLSVR